jgi:hypothetical protein
MANQRDDIMLPYLENDVISDIRFILRAKRDSNQTVIDMQQRLSMCHIAELFKML